MVALLLDALLLFPPQWSPFQPALALPSLSAWTRRAGYSVESLDLNIEFYEWLFSDECAQLLIGEVPRCADLTDEERQGHLAIFASVDAFRSRVRASLTSRPQDCQPTVPADEELIASQYTAIRAMQTYLRAVSRVSGVQISPYEFRLERGNLDSTELEAVVTSLPAVLEGYLARVVAPALATRPARLVGISCIGQEQLLFALIIGRWLKRNTNAEVVVGGTIFSRIFERGALPLRWFGEYFDVIARNEGERPLEALLGNLATGSPALAEIPGIVHQVDGRLNAPRPSAPLKPEELPVPDFSDLPLHRYFSPQLTLPLLSARGCYWGKCEFCHHGMVYGEKFKGYATARVLETVRQLAEQYGVRQFAFNDEAIPPRTLREMGDLFPSSETSGWRFTGLIKFERSYTDEDFRRLRAVGFRSLYVGLESASERVLELMRKNNTQQTMIANLRACREADIWLHCFLFFGFPGETEADARQTYEFVLDHRDIISSFGSATFVLEHNAPIYHHLSDFGISIRPRSARDIDVYYEFDSEHASGPDQAEQWRVRLNTAAARIPEFTAVGWVPRELHLYMLADLTIEQLLATGARIRDYPAGIRPTVPISEVITLAWVGGTASAVNLLTGQVVQLSPAAASATGACLSEGFSSAEVAALSPLLWEKLFGEESDELALEATSQPVPAPL